MSKEHFYDRIDSDRDIHVMLASRRRFCQVVMANKHLDGADVVVELFGKRQRTAYQASV